MPVLSRPGSCLFGRSSSVRRRRWPPADHDLLVEDRPIDDRPRPDDRVEHHDQIAHDRADVDANAGRQDRVDDRPGDHAAVADQAAVDLGRRPDPRRGAFLGSGMDDPFLVGQVELRVSSRSAMLASQYDWIVPTSCQ